MTIMMTAMFRMTIKNASFDKVLSFVMTILPVDKTYFSMKSQGKQDKPQNMND